MTRRDRQYAAKLDREIAYWRQQMKQAKTDAWLVAYGIAAGLKKARELLKTTEE
jgi:hypothetical protein